MGPDTERSRAVGIFPFNGASCGCLRVYDGSRKNYPRFASASLGPGDGKPAVLQSRSTDEAVIQLTRSGSWTDGVFIPCIMRTPSKLGD